MFKHLFLRNFDIRGILKMKLICELNESAAKDSKSQGLERPGTPLLGSAFAYCGSTEIETWCVRFPIFQENLDLQLYMLIQFT